MRSFFSRYNYFLVVLLVFAVAEIIVNPIGDFPLNDDWTYAKAVHYSMTETYTIGNFGAMTLFTHLVWGMAFVKVFGFSFTVLRISTFVSVIISLFFLNKIIFSISKNKMTAATGCLVLLFNPLYFNLSNTYMTDVNFNTLLILCCYCALNFFQTKKLSYYMLFFVLACFLVLLRQFGIIAPACFLLACFTLKEKRWQFVAGSVVGTVIVYSVLKLYESHLATILPEGSAYKFSGGIHFFDKAFWELFAWYSSQRYKVMLVQVVIFIAPLAAVYAFHRVRTYNLYSMLLLVLVNGCLAYRIFKDVEFPFHNIFENMSLGPETFYESLTAKKPHTYSENFAIILTAAKYICTSIILLALSLLIIARFEPGAPKLWLNPSVVFLVAFLFAYIFMIFITESYFDRYFIPLISIAIILMAFTGRNQAMNHAPALVLLLCFVYVSVFGTKDYLSWNRARWEAYAYLKETKQANAEQVNGGFELNCWNDRKANWWYDYTTLEDFTYLIQFKKEEGFALLKEYEFQRYFPYKKDKINIFVKQAKE